MTRKITLDELVIFLGLGTDIENLDKEVYSLDYSAQRGSLILHLKNKPIDPQTFKELQEVDFTEATPTLQPISIKVVSIDEILAYVEQVNAEELAEEH
jgi:hypothetical protein